VCLPLLIFPCTIKSRSSLLAPAQPGWSQKKGRKTVVVCGTVEISFVELEYIEFYDLNVTELVHARRLLLSVFVVVAWHAELYRLLFFFVCR